MVSLIFDAVNVIPILGTAMAGCYWIGLTFYLKKTGHGIISWRRLAPTLVSLAIEIMPFLQVLPSIFASTLAIIILSRLEDRTGLNIVKHASPKMRLPRKPQPLNQDGVRGPRQREPQIINVTEDNV